MTIMLSNTNIISSNIPPTLSLIKRTRSVRAQLRSSDSQTIILPGKPFNKVRVYTDCSHLSTAPNNAVSFHNVDQF